MREGRGNGGEGEGAGGAGSTHLDVAYGVCGSVVELWFVQSSTY